MTTSPSISVVIATYSRARLLEECLQHLAAQPFEADDEVVVIDNGSNDDTAAVIAHYQARFPVPLRGLFESRPGKSHALSTGLAIAGGDVLAFIDDDVNVDAAWLQTVRDAMREPDTALMAGRVLPRWDDSVTDWIRQAPAVHARLGAPLGLLEYPSEVRELGDRTALGANMAVRRKVLEQVGGFAANLGKLRGTLLSGEDHDFCRRVQRAGLRSIYVPQAVVHHWVPADRTRVGYFLKWFYWSGITNAILDADNVSLHLAKRAMLATFQAARALLLARSATALHHATDVAFAAGYASRRLGKRS